MSQTHGLGSNTIIAFISIVDVPRAKAFYQDTLGLRLVMEEPPFALAFEANGIMLRFGMAKELPPVHGTVLGWQVPEFTQPLGTWHRSEFVSSGLRVWTRMTSVSGVHLRARRSLGSKTPMETF